MLLPVKLIRHNSFKLVFIGLAFVLISAQAIGQKNTYERATVYVTEESGDQYITNMGSYAFKTWDQPDEQYANVMIDDDETFQTIVGFGGALNDASAVNFHKLSPENQEKFLEACFDPEEGNGYTLCRTSIHSCDYAREPYTYVEEGDASLESFSVDHDREYRIPFIKKALKEADGNIKIYASPWSPPAWMKTNGEMLHGGKLKSKYRQTWADYYVKFINAYESEDIPIWGLTVQNEPMATQVWESCIYTAQEERDFVRDYLGPALEKNGLSDVKLMIWDHNRNIMYQRAEVVYDDPEASKYIWGMGFHWYVGDNFENVRRVHEAFPDKKLIHTEGGMGASWEAGVHQAENIIHDLNNWANGWVFWNLLLNENGGPRHAGGLGSTNSMVVDTSTGELTINPPYYYFGHFSRFIKPGAKRIACTTSKDDLLATAFKNPNGKVSVVILNLSEQDQFFKLWLDGEVVEYTSSPRSIITMVLS